MARQEDRGIDLNARHIQTRNSDIDPTQLIPERLKEKLTDGLVELLAGSGERWDAVRLVGLADRLAEAAALAVRDDSPPGANETGGRAERNGAPESTTLR